MGSGGWGVQVDRRSSGWVSVVRGGGGGFGESSERRKEMAQVCGHGSKRWGGGCEVKKRQTLGAGDSLTESFCSLRTFRIRNRK